MGTGSLLGVKWTGCGVDHPTPSSAKVMNEWSHTSTPLGAFRACCKANVVIDFTVILRVSQPLRTVAYPEIFFGGMGQHFQLRTEGRENRNRGAVTP
jgi:hypothetical protein